MLKGNKPSRLLRIMSFKSRQHISIGFSDETLHNLGWGEAEKEVILLLCNEDDVGGFSWLQVLGVCMCIFYLF